MPQHRTRTDRLLRWSLLALFLIIPSNASADSIPAADYHKNVQRAIDRTPTSDKRNLLTEANIHFLLALEALKKAETL